MNQLNVKNSFPLSYAQQRLWFIEKINNGSPAYNIPLAIELRGELQEKHLAQAYKILLERHVVMRTVIRDIGGTAYQMILPISDFSLEIDTEYGVENLTSYLKDQARKTFSLTEGPLINFKLIKLSDDHHIVILIMHHIIADEWSIDIFLSELAKVYNALSEGQNPNLEPLPLTYVEFSERQKIYLQSEDLQEQLQFWSDYLTDFPRLTTIPHDYTRPQESNYHGGVYRSQYPLHIYDELLQLSKQHRSSLFMILLTAYIILLHKYSGEFDIVIGTPVSNRHYDDVQNIIGFFVNTVPLRIKINEDDTLLSLVDKVRDNVLDCYDMQDVPFDKIVDELRVNRDLAQHPIFQTMFFLDTPKNCNELFNGLSVEYDIIDNDTAKFDLLLSLRPNPNDLEVRFEYATELYKETTMKRLCENYLSILQTLIGSPDALVCEIDIVSFVEKKSLEKLAEGRKLSLTQTSILGLFEQQVLKYQNSISVIDDENTYTYQQLCKRINQLSHYLTSIDVKKGDVVAVFLERSIDALVAMLSIFKLGAVYLPIDIYTPIERVNYILNQSNTTLLICSENVAHINIQSTLNLVEKSVLLESQMTTNIQTELFSHDLAYIIYTSGSTGTPKGVVVSHGALLNNYCATQAVLNLNSDDKVLAITPYGFDVSLHDYCLPLCVGASVIIARQDEYKDAYALINTIEDYKITFLQATPSTLHMLLTANWQPQKRLKIVAAGEALPVALANHLSENTTLYNFYGPTEATIYTTAEKIEVGSNQILIGAPLGNYRVKVLDENQNQVPIGAIGELYIGGMGLSSGYFNAPDLNNKAFFHINGSRYYKTGDRVRMLENGKLQYLGRIDNQVKIRGNRVELGEIETVLNTHPAILQSVVIAREDLSDHQTLAAYFVTQGDEELSAKILEAFLQQQLPRYMLPSHYMQLKEFKLNDNHKIDRKALPVPVVQQTTLDYEKPRNEIEKKLAAIWSSLLKQKQIGIDDNFFHIGGDSIISIQFVSQARKLGYKLAVKQLFLTPTIRQLAKECEVLSVTEKNEAISSCTIQSTSSIMPDSFSLSPIQKTLFFQSLYNRDSEAYILLNLFKIKPDTDVLILKKSWQHVIDSYDALRIQLDWQGQEEPRQRILNDVDVVWEVLDYSQATPKECEQRLKTLLQEEHMRGLDLSKAPLMRLVYVKAATNEAYLLWVYHHIILDGWSGPIILNAVEESYSAFINAEQPYGAQSQQYRDYLNWLQHRQQGNDRNFWKKYLEDIELPCNLELPKELPKEHPKKLGSEITNHHSEYKSIVRKLSQENTQQLVEFSRQHQITLNTVIQLAWAIVLQKNLQKNDFLFGVVFSGRAFDVEGIEHIPGAFINTLPFRAKFNANQSVNVLLQVFQEQNLELQDYSYDSLANIKSYSFDDKNVDLFNTILVFENYPYEQFSSEESENLLQLITSVDRNEFPLSVAVNPGREMEFHFNYKWKCFDEGTVQRLKNQLLLAIEQIIRFPEKTIDELDVLDLQDKMTLVYEMNNNNTEKVENRTILELFTDQVQASPENCAIHFNKDTISYIELDQRSNQLANYLGEFELKENDVVAVYFDKSIDFIVSILATLKIGAAYLAIDDSLPVQRIEYMLSDSACKLIITDEKFAKNHIATKANIINLTEKQSLIQLHDCNYVGPEVPLNALAYVIYTSGTTGTPKGVMVEHAGLSNFIQYMMSMKGNTKGTKSSLWTSTLFDVSAYEIWSALSAGESLYIIDAKDRLYPNRFFKFLTENHICNAYIPPVYLNDFSLWLAQSHDDCSLTNLLLGVEPISADTITTLQKHLPMLNIINGYGPTEATICCTCYKVPRNDVSPYTNILPIGKPIWNTQIYLLDNNLQLVPQGAVGEIYVAGDALSRGYVNSLEELNHFITANIFDKKDIRLYKTGDKARYLPDGNIEYIGRINEQIKLRGYRIEPKEISYHLKKLTGIKDAYVTMVTAENQQPKLVAYLKSDQATIKHDEIRIALSQSMPSYMIPNKFIWLEQFPMTTNGKLDIVALKALESEPVTLEQKSEKQSPENENEEKLIEIFKLIFELEEISRDDDFFELGGHSILAIEVILKCQAAGFMLDVKDIFEHPIIKDLATKFTFENQEVRNEMVEVCSEPFSITPIQSWFFEKNFHNKNQFNQSFIFDVNKKLDISCLNKAIALLYKIHPELNSQFNKVYGHWKQQYVLTDVSPTKVIECVIDRDDDYENSISKIIANEQKKLDIEKGDLARFVLFKKAGADTKLFITIHHLVTDGVSWRIILGDICEIYSQIITGNNTPKVHTSQLFSKWSAALHKYAKNSELLKEISYWKELTSEGHCEIPTDMFCIDSTMESARHVRKTLAQDETKVLLSDVGRTFGVTINAILLTALGKTLLSWANQKSLLINLEGHGREAVIGDIDISKTLGWFTSLFPVRLNATDYNNVHMSLQDVNNQLCNIPEKGVGYGILKYIVKEAIFENISPEICFNYLGQWDTQNNSESLLGFSMLQTSENHNLLNQMLYKLDINCMVLDGQFRIEWTYSEKQYNQSTVENLAAVFQLNLRSIIEAVKDHQEKHYPLTHSQAGLLLHYLNNMEENVNQCNGNYHVQSVIKFNTPVTEAIFKQAWQAVIEQHDMLKVIFDWDDLSLLQQKVVDKQKLEWNSLRWQLSSIDEFNKQLQLLLQQDRASPFDLAVHTPLRFYFIQCSNDQSYFLWSHHHVLLDGWSVASLLSKVRIKYNELTNRINKVSQSVINNCNYFQWIAQQNKHDALDFWQSYLTGIEDTINLCARNKQTDNQAAFSVKEFAFSEVETTALENYTRSSHITVNTVIQLAWGLVLSKYLQRRDLLFGVVVSGRAIPVVGIGDMLGLFINTLPLRITFEQNVSIEQQLQKIQSDMLAIQQHGHLSLAEIQVQSGLSGQLFDNIMAFANYPHEISEDMEGLSFETIKTVENTEYPLCIAVLPKKQLTIRFTYQTASITDSKIKNIMESLSNVVRKIISA